MSGGAGNTSGGSNKFEPPGYAQGYDIELLKRANQQSQTPFQAYSGQRFAPFTPLQNQGFNLAGQYATTGQGLTGAGAGQLQNTLAGNYLNSNPYIDQMVGQAQGDIADQYKYMTAPSNMAMASRSGSLDNSGIAGKDMMDRFSSQRAMGDVENQIRYGNYANERQNMMAASQPALNYGQSSLGQAAQAGTQQQQLGQAQQDFNYQEFLRQLDQPNQNLSVLQSNLATAQGGFGAGASKTPNPNPWMYPAVGAAAAMSGK